MVAFDRNGLREHLLEPGVAEHADDQEAGVAHVRERGASADVPPKSVVERAKSPYPSTQDPAYAAELQKQVKELISHGDRAPELLNADRVRTAANLDQSEVDSPTRNVRTRPGRLRLGRPPPPDRADLTLPGHGSVCSGVRAGLGE